MNSQSRFVEWFDDNLIPKTEDIPQDVPPGAYVIVDVLFFSTTAVEILANGAEYIYMTEQRGDEIEYQQDNPRALIGGDRTEDFEPVDGYDFFNSPSYVNSVDLEGRPVAMTSSNAGRTINRLTGHDVDVYIAGPQNARATANHLREKDQEIYPVCAGTRGEVNIEDKIGAALFGRELHESPISRVEEEIYQWMITVAKGEDYADKHPVRREDIDEYSTSFNSRDLVVELEGRRLTAREQQ